MDYAKESLRLHREWKGKIQVTTKVDVNSREALSLAYTPGVAQPCLEIQKNVNESFELTRRWNTIAVVTDGTAVLGLGDIGPEAGMPVMEGKCALFNAFGGVDAFPLCIRSKNVEDIVNTVSLLAGSFGGINLEDISAPRCFEIEKQLKERCDIPIFHDDQHGTAIVTGAALLNALKLVKKDISKIEVVINGAGSAGVAIAKFVMSMGVKNLVMCDSNGIICEGAQNLNSSKLEIATLTNRKLLKGTLANALVGADVFIGVSAPNCVTKEMVKSMANDAILLPMANPTPEIFPEDAKKAGARVVGTGRSDFPNQINNVLVFPGVFRGTLDTRASDINDEMKLAAAYAIASLISEKELSEDYIIPDAFNPHVHKAVAEAVAKAAIASGVARKI